MFSCRKDRFKSVFFGWVFYKCILGSKGKTKEKKNLSCILISHCLESTFHLIKAHHVCKTEITTLLKCVSNIVELRDDHLFIFCICQKKLQKKRFNSVLSKGDELHVRCIFKPRGQRSDKETDESVDKSCFIFLPDAFRPS